jgi:hypothetical protein
LILICAKAELTGRPQFITLKTLSFLYLNKPAGQFSGFDHLCRYIFKQVAKIFHLTFQKIFLDFMQF